MRSADVYRSVAIIGAGPGGLVTARYLRSQGFDCTIFEQSRQLGGQWNAGSTHSGIWPAMRTNTSRVLTCFSDLPHDPNIPTYPTNAEVLAYLNRYAEQWGLHQAIKCNTRVEKLDRTEAGYSLHYTENGGAVVRARFDRVVVASGRFNKPSTPQVQGLETFSGEGGIIHTFRYKEPEVYRGLRVLVAGCAISALEIASDLAMLGARVVSSYRRQRYVLPKLFAGVPTDHMAFTRFTALLAEAFSPHVAATELKQLVLRANGSPEQYGAFKPADDLAQAGITLSQYFLPLVAEGRITVKPWMRAVDGQRVTFADGTHEIFDAIIFGTGYDLSLPFLSDSLRAALAVDREHIDLFNFTFHPDLPGLAFVGLYDQSGPYLPVLELQARWITYTWAGLIDLPVSKAREAIARYRSTRGQPQKQAMHKLALLFARAAGVEPLPEEYPELARALLFGPLAPISFRMTGPDFLPDAPELFRAEAAAFEAITSPEFREEEAEKVKALESRGHCAGTSAKVSA